MNPSISLPAFAALGLSAPIIRAVAEKGYTTPSPIQAQSIPALLSGGDLLGIAQTGTGKTASFALPILHRLAQKPIAKPRRIRCLILAPTRELAVQIQDSFQAYGRYLPLKCTTIFGGVSQHAQVKALSRGVDIVIATPGRLLDLMKQGHADLGAVEILTLDEADRMLDMGFIPDVKRIVGTLPRQRQSILLSATMPETIAHLAQGILSNPTRVDITPEVVTVDRIDQRLYMVAANDKRALLTHLLQDKGLQRVIVFTRTKHGANKVAISLEKAGIRADAIHGNKSQGARQRALNEFRSGGIRVLVATDIASRGIDVSGVTHVINFEMPNQPESYVHRIGRTARAGADGIALSLCAPDELPYLRDIQKLTNHRQNIVNDHPFALPANATPSEGNRAHAQQPGRRRHNHGSRSPHAPHGAGQRRPKPRQVA